MVNDKINGLLDEVIETELLSLSEMERGSETKTATIKDVTELYKLRIEEAKAEQAKVDSRREAEVRRLQLQAQSFDRWLNFGATVGTTVVGWILYNTWFHQGIEFEQTGTVRNPWTRTLMTKMFPKK